MVLHPRQGSLRLASSLGLVTLGLVACSPSGSTPPPPTFTAVTSTNDSGAGSLRTLLTTAKSGDTLRFTTSGTVTLAAPLVLDKNVTIEADEGVNVVLRAAGQVLSVNANTTARVRRLILSGANAAPLAAQQVVAPRLGGVISNEGNLTLDTVTVTNGRATGGGGIWNKANATLELVNVTISNNAAELLSNSADPANLGQGGGILNDGAVRLQSGTMSNNTATVAGGGIFNRGAGTFTRTGGTVANNTPDQINPDPALTERDFVWPSDWTVSSPGEARRGGTLRQSITSNYLTANPFTAADALSIPSQLGSAGLLVQDPRTGDFVPYMAQSYTVSSDGLTWDFKLRPDLKFSDGSPITPDDFVSTVRIHQDEAVGSSARLTFTGVTISKTGSDTLRVVFATRSASTPSRLSFTPWPDKIFGSAYRSGGANAVKALWPLTVDPATVVSPGPFKLATISAGGAGATFVRNDFFGEWNVDSANNPLPYLDGVTVSKSATSPLDDFLADRIDLIGLGSSQLDAVRGQAGIVLKENYSAQAASTWITFNMNRASDPEKQRLFRDVNFRRAMSHLVNRARIIQEVFGGAAEPVYTSVYPIFDEWISPTASKYDFNVDEAKRLLATLGYDRMNAEGFLTNAQGRVLEFDLETNPGQREALVRIFAEGARLAGVKVNQKIIDFNILGQHLTSTGDDRPFDAILLGLSGGNDTWPVGGVNVTPCTGNLHAFNRSGACLFDWEREAERLYLEGDAELNSVRRRQIGYQLQDLESSQQPFIYLAAPKASVAWRSRVRGELPERLANAYNGTRFLPLTWIGN
ncbi:ABC transporter substrate-binding protein [Deinococcus yavapaiensis]|uniref:ABC-type transport system substrate-binding protein n=1 Tax=Deinococcus yavapaiensis KR-236 TaxID=694435 RepID=A0A318S5R9_9DEIO|nr:ABC transporter substrate-binding protein [Deinococcus yavapaiensis]PYE53905.1 ABC-type transport system substrate-binding protein [Deinococcus yavapaiensis KR-236]